MNHIRKCRRIRDFRYFRGYGRARAKIVCLPIYDDLVRRLHIQKRGVLDDLVAGKKVILPVRIYKSTHYSASMITIVPLFWVVTSEGIAVKTVMPPTAV